MEVPGGYRRCPVPRICKSESWTSAARRGAFCKPVLGADVVKTIHPQHAGRIPAENRPVAVTQPDVEILGGNLVAFGQDGALARSQGPIERLAVDRAGPTDPGFRASLRGVVSVVAAAAKDFEIGHQLGATRPIVGPMVHIRTRFTAPRAGCSMVREGFRALALPHLGIEVLAVEQLTIGEMSHDQKRSPDRWKTAPGFKDGADPTRKSGLSPASSSGLIEGMGRSPTGGKEKMLPWHQAGA
jgi:hypothetical protein